MAPPTPINFDYDFSPYGNKIRLLFAAIGVPFQRNDVETVLPRPTLEKLGITYRRIPVLAIGKDVYADTSLIISAVQRAYGALPSSPADAAYETFGNALFAHGLSQISPAILTPSFLKDREAIFPALSRPDLGTLKPSGLGEWKARFNTLEHQMLAIGPFLGGAQALGLADVHVAWVTRWALNSLQLSKEKGFSKEDFPRIYAWIARLPEPKYEDISSEKAIETFTSAEYHSGDLTVNEQDPLQFKKGTAVNVEGFDTAPGKFPQKGELIGLNDEEVVLGLPTGIRLHFPRLGYIVRAA